MILPLSVSALLPKERLLKKLYLGNGFIDMVAFDLVPSVERYCHPDGGGGRCRDSTDEVNRGTRQMDDSVPLLSIRQ